MNLVCKPQNNYAINNQRVFNYSYTCVSIFQILPFEFLNIASIYILLGTKLLSALQIVNIPLKWIQKLN